MVPGDLWTGNDGVATVVIESTLRFGELMILVSLNRRQLGSSVRFMNPYPNNPMASAINAARPITNALSQRMMCSCLTRASEALE